MPRETSPPTPRPWLLVALILIAICVAYANSFQNAFEFDDFHTITDNSAVRSLSNLPAFFTDATTFSVLPANRTYRPVVSASLAIDYALGRGYVPLWFHLSTFFWFLALVGTLTVFYRRIFDEAQAGRASVYLALLSAAWFGLHPAIAETVNYIIQRGDLYCTLGCVAALVVWMRFPRWRRTGVYLLPFALALLSKPPAAVFPVLLFFFVYFFEHAGATNRVRKALWSSVPALAVTVVLLVLQSAMTPKSFTASDLSAWSYRMTQPYVWLRYFSELFLPIHLNVDSDLGPLQGFGLAMAAGFLFLSALAAGITYTSRRRKLYPIAYGLIWFVVTQLPTSLYPLSEVENDHRMFFSFAGLIPAIVWAAWQAWQRIVPIQWQRYLRPALISVAALALVLYGYGTHVRNAVWHTQESLWRDDVQKSPRNGRGLMIYGLTQMNKGAYPAALDYFTRALEFTPNYPTLETNLGVVYGAMDRPLDAEKHFARAVALAPQDDAARAFYARWLFQQGRLQESIAEAKEAISLNPARQLQHDILQDDYRQLDRQGPKAQNEIPAGAVELINRSLALNQQGRYAESIEAAKQALAIDPDIPEGWNNIAAGEQSLQHWDAAISAARKALALRPDFQLARNNLAWAESQKAKNGN